MKKASLAERVFGAVAAAVLRWPWWIIGAFLVLAAAGILLTALKLEMRTDQNDLVSRDAAYNRRYLDFIDEFGDLEYLYVVIEVDGDPRLAMKVADAVAEETGKLAEHVREVHHRIPVEDFAESALLLGPEEELRALGRTVEQGSETLKRFARIDGFARMLSLLADSLDPSVGEKSPELARWGFKVADVALESIAAAARGEAPRPLEGSLEEALAGDEVDPRRKGYLFSKNGLLAFVEIMPQKNFQTLEVISEPLAEIRRALDRVRERFRGARPGGVRLGLTGRPVLQADEMRTANQDMTVSTIAAFVLVAVLFVLVFKRMRRPLLACFALAVGIAITSGAVTLTIGHLTLLSVVFTTMLVGLGVDFGVHFLARYQEELLLADDIEGSIRGTLVTTGVGIWTGGVTTAAAFYSTLFVDFRGLMELGFVAGTGLLICLVTMLAFLPALILVTDRHIRRRRGLHPPRLVRVPFLSSASRHPRTTIAALLALTAAGFYHFKGVPYNWNLLDLQARNLESVDYELKIIKDSDRSTWFAAFILDSLEKVDATVEALRPAQEAGVVGDVESIRDFVRRDQAERRKLLGPARDIVRGVSVSSSSASFDRDRFAASLGKLLERLDHLQSLAASRGGGASADAVKAIDLLIRRVEEIQGLAEKEPEAAAARLAPYERRWLEELAALRGKLLRRLDPPEILPASLPAQIHHRFVSDDERRYLVYAYPKRDIWEEKNMKEFVQAVRKVDPGVTGVPIQVFESASIMRDGFLLSSLYSLILVFGLIVFDFRDLKAALLAMVPLFAGLLWALQLMPALGLDFNLANFFSLPILIGYGVDGGVHVIHRFRELGSTADVGRTTGSAIALSSVTTIVGFGAMGLARHRGVASLGMVTALGCATTLAAAVVLLPSLLELLEARRKGRARPS